MDIAPWDYNVFYLTAKRFSLFDKENQSLYPREKLSDAVQRKTRLQIKQIHEDINFEVRQTEGNKNKCMKGIKSNIMLTSRT